MKGEGIEGSSEFARMDEARKIERLQAVFLTAVGNASCVGGLGKTRQRADCYAQVDKNKDSLSNK